MHHYAGTPRAGTLSVQCAGDLLVGRGYGDWRPKLRACISITVTTYVGCHIKGVITSPAGRYTFNHISHYFTLHSQLGPHAWPEPSHLRNRVSASPACSSHTAADSEPHLQEKQTDACSKFPGACIGVSFPEPKHGKLIKLNLGCVRRLQKPLTFSDR